MMLGKYRLLAELGRGGMSKVYLAMARGPAGFNKLVVVKQIRAHLAEEQDFVTMFLDEARLAARLSHPNVVQTNEVGQEGTDYFIAMEYLEGQTLNRILSKLGRGSGAGGPGTPHEVSLAMQLRVMSESLRGLHYAHELKDFDGKQLGVVHRDISPHNIMVTYSGEVKVLDFGIAKAMNSSVETRTGVLKGKISYMSPEQAMTEKVDRRADIFSAGVCLWQIAAGQRMFRGQSDVVVLQRLMSGDIPDVRAAAPDIDPRFEAIIKRSLAPKREDRHATAAELQEELEAYVDSLGDRRGPRDLGKVLSDFFAADRTRINAIVEQQMTMDPAAVEHLPFLDNPATESGPRSRAGSSPSTSYRVGTGATPLAGSPSLDRHPPSVAPDGTSAATVHETGATLTSSSGSKRPLFALAAIAGAVLALVVSFIALRNRGDGQASPSASSTAGASYTLRIESTPSGATVREGDRVLGATPLALTVKEGEPARKFIALLDGYEPKTIDAPAATGDLLLQASLVPAPTAEPGAIQSATPVASSTGAIRHPPPYVGRPPPPTPPPPPPPDRPPPDIHIKR